MSEVNQHELQMLVTKARYADDDSFDGAVREVAKYINDQSVALDTFKALVTRGPLADGDVPSKQERDLLFDVGLGVKVAAGGEDGANAATQLGWYVWKAYSELTEPQQIDPEGADGVIGGTGTDDSGVEPVSVMEPVVSTESLAEEVDVEFLWDALHTQFHDIPDQTIQVNRDVIQRYGELLTQTYCDPLWVKQESPEMGDLEVEHTTYHAKMLQFHCLSLTRLDSELIDAEFTLKALQYGSELHNKLYDCVS